MIQKIKGAEDILPKDSYKWQYIEDVARDLFERYLYQEIRTPMMESYDLFSRSVGDTTDIVSKEMYDFYDKGERHIALRPEGTAGVVRAYVEHKLHGPEFAKPLKLYYIGPMFRYERPQAGRQRQFHQIGVEAFGSVNPATDAEIIALAWHFFEELEVKNLKLYLNSLGKPEERQVYREALIEYFTPVKDQLSKDSQKRLETNPMRIIDSKAPEDKALSQDAPAIIDFLGDESRKHFEQVQAHLDALNIPYTIDPTIVRGLDYYQHTIFEIIVEDDSIGAQSTVCGGGRYDGLVEQIGGPAESGIGFAIGMERLLILLEEQGIEIPAVEPVDIYVMGLGEEVETVTLQIVQAARQAGLIAERDYLGRSMKSQFKTISKLNTKLVMTVGEQELADGLVQLKNQETGKQATEKLADVLADIASVYRKHTMDTSVIDEFFKGGF